MTNGEGWDWMPFFPPGTRVLALPNWRNPRLYLSTQNAFQRWEHSSLYPASRSSARLYRLALRLQATAGATKTRTVHSSDWPLGEFVQGRLPRTTFVVVLRGTLGPAQEITVQLRDEKGRVSGYLKYAEKAAARKRLRQEQLMLRNIPQGMGPEPMKFGPLGGGEALLKSPVPGKPLAATLSPPKAMISLLESLVVAPPVPLESHPWVRRMRDRAMPGPDDWFESLKGRNWPVTIQHGDFVPWNLIVKPDGSLQAIDWEYGTLEGFPYLDLVHYVLQTSALIYRRPPAEAVRYAIWYLSRHPDFALSDAEIRSLIRLSAYDAYRKSLDDGQSPDAGLQPWRRTVWKNTVYGT